MRADDLAVLDDQSVSLATRTAKDSAAVEAQIKARREGGCRVRKEADLRSRK